MKNSILTLLLLFSFTTFAQEEKKLGVFESDTTWLKEIIKFPLGFAPEIKFEGYEDLRFAKNWRKKDSPDFWCYTFVWQINGTKKLSAQDLETNIKLYYDGLMTAVNKKENFKIPETMVLFIENKDTKQDYDYIGKVRFHDSFSTEKLITLNITVNSLYCKEKNTSTIVFRLSPKAFDNEIWERYNAIKLRKNICTD